MLREFTAEISQICCLSLTHPPIAEYAGFNPLRLVLRELPF